MRFAPLTKMGDNVQTYKYVVRNVAKRHGKVATLRRTSITSIATCRAAARVAVLVPVQHRRRCPDSRPAIRRSGDPAEL